MSPKLAIGLLAAACATMALVRGDFRSPVARPRIELNFWNGFTGPDGRTMLRLIREFNQENPGVRVSMQRMDWATYYNKLMVAAVDGRGPEMFVIHASTLPRMRQAGFLVDVDDLFGAGGVPVTDFDPYVLNQVRFDGHFVGLPLDIHPQGLYANREMLAEVGLNAPPANREEFLRAAKAIRRDNDGDGKPDRWGFALTLWRNNFQSLMPQFGGRYLDENGQPDLANPGNVAALEFLVSLTGKDRLIPPPENGLGWVGYRQSKVGMVWDGVYMLGDLQRLQGLEYVAAPIPQIGPRPGTMADSHVLCIRTGLPQETQQAAERFLAFLSAHSIQWAAAGQVPARKSIRQTPEFLAMPVQAAFARQVPNMMYPPRTTALFELTQEIDLAVEKALRGRSTAKEALEVANANATRVFARDRKDRGPR